MGVIAVDRFFRSVPELFARGLMAPGIFLGCGEAAWLGPLQRKGLYYFVVVSCCHYYYDIKELVHAVTYSVHTFLSSSPYTTHITYLEQKDKVFHGDAELRCQYQCLLVCSLGSRHSSVHHLHAANKLEVLHTPI